MAKYVEKKEPLIVDIEFYDSKKGHIAVIPQTHHEDPRVGVIATTNEIVYEGDAIVFWGKDDTGEKHSVMRADAVSAFFEPVAEAPAAPAAPALPPPNPLDVLDLGEQPDTEPT